MPGVEPVEPGGNGISGGAAMAIVAGVLVLVGISAWTLIPDLTDTEDATTAAETEEARCPSLWGSAQLDWGSTRAGFADITWNGKEYRVAIEETDFADTPTGFRATFDWHFPEGTISLLENREATPEGDVYRFESEIVVTGGGEGSWAWSGVSDVGAGVNEYLAIEGDLCIDS